MQAEPAGAGMQNFTSTVDESGTAEDGIIGDDVQARDQSDEA
jgi:hypothetical protein